MNDDQEVIEAGQDHEEAQQLPETKFSLDDWQKAHEDKASASGWKPFDEYVASGGDPMKWKTADAFNVYGEMIGTIKKTQKDFEQRLEGVQKLSQAQLAAQREELLAKRDLAIEDGNKAAVHALDRQIGNLNVAPVPQSTGELDEWNARNAWIFEDSPKSDRAKSVFGKAVAAGKPVSAAIQLVEEDIQRHFGETKPAPRVNIPESERGRGSVAFGKKTSALSMSDLTDDERVAWKHMPQAWNNDEKKFLQSVADMRKAGRG